MTVKVSVIFVYFNTPREISNAISSVKSGAGGIAHEIIIVDNNSTIPLPKKIVSDKKVKVLKNKRNVGYGQALNIGAKNARGDYLLFSNTDTVYSAGSIKKLVDEIEADTGLGIIGPKMVNEAGNTLLTRSRTPIFPVTTLVYSSLGSMPGFKKIWDWFHYKGKNKSVVEVVGGASILTRKELFQSIGGFDPNFFLFFEEADICKRVRNKKYKIKYLSSAVVTHSVGKSLSNKDLIRKYFELSRFRFVYKHQGRDAAVFSEALIKFFSLTNLLLLGIFVFSLFLNLNKITSLMMFYGDFARDMLVARDMLINGTIPLVGIPSSVVWLHQGPLSIYLIGLSFIFGGFEAWVPAVFFATLGSATTILVYYLGKTLFNGRVGIISAAIFAASPLVVINARIPYHTAPMPFFAAIFFISLYKFLECKCNKYLLLTGFFLGILFQLELSNGVLFFVLIILLLFNRIKFSIKQFSLLIVSFSLGILPVLIYDLSHRFVQTLGFAAWVANRVRLFFGITLSGASTSDHLPSATALIRDQLVRFVFPPHLLVSYVLILAVITFLFITIFKKRKNLNIGEQVLAVGIFIPILGFAIHSQPGTAYFPVLFPLLAISMGLLFSNIISKSRLLYAVLVIFILSNALFTVKNSYFLYVNGKGGTEINYWNYGLGTSYAEQEKLISLMKKHADGQDILILPGGFLTMFKTSIDNYRYIAWQMGLKESQGGIKYVIYQNMDEIPEGSKIVFKTDSLAVILNE